MLLRVVLCLPFFLFFGLTSRAGRVDTLQVESTAMHRSFKCVVVTPDRYDSTTTERFPVLYLLHGYSGNYRG